MVFEDEPTLDNLVGTAKQFTDDFVAAMENEGLYKTMGVDCDKTFLLSGQPGTGKTMVIRALNNSLNTKAHEICKANKGTCKMDDFKMPIFEYSIGKFGTCYINEGSRRVQDFFDYVGAVSIYGIKTLIAIDECDALLMSRGSDVRSHGEDRKVLETLMKNLQLAHDTENMFVVLMTNCEGDIDEASIRAGRIDKKYVFKLPNLQERKLAYKQFIDEANNKAKYNVVRKYNLDNMALESEGFNYADIKESVRGAIKQRATELAKIRTDKIITAGYVNGDRIIKYITEHKTSRKGGKALIGFK